MRPLWLAPLAGPSPFGRAQVLRLYRRVILTRFPRGIAKDLANERRHP
jgi:hypothetical protein